jgi:tetratricopeptide (TPR) repeat protein
LNNKTAVKAADHCLPRLTQSLWWVMLNKSAAQRKLTRKEQRNLDLEISFMEGVVKRDPRFYEAWEVLSEDYSRRAKFEEGVKADEHLARFLPDDPDVLYNLACSYSLTRRIDQAMAALSRAIGKGLKDFKWLLRDPDLANLRKDPLFKKGWAKISAVKSGVR